jgi:Flp pilus assembly protein TadG
MNLLQRFQSHTGGNFAVMGAVLMLPLAIGAGTSVDYSRAVNVRTKLQSAADATALALARDAGKLTDAELQAKGDVIFAATYGAQSGTDRFQRASFTATKTSKLVTVTVSGSIPNTLMKLAGMPTTEIAAGGQAAWGVRKIEVALVLDNTGSMAANNKMTELKKAAKNLVSTLEKVATEPGSVKISLVPFTTQVRLDPSLKTASWLDFATTGTNKATWNGCVKDRAQPYDVTDGGSALYPAVTCAVSTLAPVKALTSDFASLRSAIDGMSPNGNTNITIGLAWGLTTLSPADPMSGGTAFGTDGVDKFVIALTDGDNTQNAWTTSKYQIDQRTTAACNDIKTASRKVKLYTIRVLDGDASLLRNCATSASMFFDVSTASQLDAVFRKIADEISAIRLTN